MFEEVFQSFYDPRFYAACVVIVVMMLFVKALWRVMLVVMSPIGYFIARRIWKYLCVRYKINYPISFELGGDMREFATTEGKKIKNRTAYATAKNGEHAVVTWLFLMTHSPLAIIRTVCHEYGHLYLGHVRTSVAMNTDPWEREREADTWALYSMKNMPLLLKVCGILFRDTDCYWNPYTKDELRKPAYQQGAPSFRLLKEMYYCFGVDYRGGISKLCK